MVNAIIAGGFPVPIKGTRKTSNAKLGIVCRAAVIPIIISAAFLWRVRKIPKGTATKIAIMIERKDR